MTTAIQRIALNKLKGLWQQQGSLGGFLNKLRERSGKSPLYYDDTAPPYVSIGSLEPLEMTKAEANALRSWFIEHGLSEYDIASKEDLVPGQFNIFEQGYSFEIHIRKYEDFDPDRDEHFPKPTGDIQKYHVKLHLDDFVRLQLEFLREGWFSREDAEHTPKLPSFEPK